MPRGDKPIYVIRARQEPRSDYLTTVGSAWKFREGDGYVLRIHSMPVNWDGSFILVPPFTAGEEAENAQSATPTQQRRPSKVS